jgi:hypothetical protein
MGKDGNNIATSENIKTSYIAVFVAAAVLYISTCAPGPVWQDSGVIQYRVWHNDIEGELGLAISHPLYYLIGIGVKYVQLGEFGYRINLLTAVTSAVAIANLYLLLRLWLGKSFPAFIGAATLALSHTFWRHATIAETYNLYIALLLAELVVVLRYVQTKRPGFLYALGFLNGLAIANHMLAVIGFACWAVFLLALLLKKEIRLKSLAIIITLWIIGAGPYEYLIVKNLVQTGDLLATLESVLFGTSYQDDVLNVRISLRIIRENICWIALNFPTPNALLFFAGLYAVHKLAPARVFANILLALLILFLVFAFRYTVVDRYAFFIPFYCIVSILIGVGAHYFIGLKKHKALTYLIIVFTLLPIPAYVVAPKVAKKLGITSGRGREIPYRDDHKYFLQPWRTGYRGAEKFADEILSSVETDAIVYADSTTAPPLLYAQEVKSRRGDVKMISSIASSQNAPEFDEQTVAKLLSERAIYVVCPVSGYCPEFILENYDFVKAGIVWRVVERK